MQNYLNKIKRLTDSGKRIISTNILINKLGDGEVKQQYVHDLLEMIALFNKEHVELKQELDDASKGKVVNLSVYKLKKIIK